MFPGRYPSSAPTAAGVLPETFPSNRITISTRGKTVEVVGRGWGHGSGMSQWGAHGLAQQGASYTDILAHYYTGTSVGTVPAGPPIEVGVQWGASSVQAGGSFDIVDGRGKTIVRGALGTWNFAWAGDGAVAIDPPAGYGLPLEVGIVNAPRRVKVGEAAFLTVALSRPAKVRTETSTSPTGYRDPGVEVRDAGRRRVVWLAPLEEGRYRVRVRARAGPTLRRSEPIEIIVTPAVARAVDEPDDRPADENQNRPPYVLIVALAAGFLGVVIALLVARSRKRPVG
jgi:hypothetical protein